MGMKKQILFAHSGGTQGSPGQGSYDLVHWLRKEPLDLSCNFTGNKVKEPEEVR